MNIKKLVNARDKYSPMNIQWRVLLAIAVSLSFTVPIVDIDGEQGVLILVVMSTFVAAFVYSVISLYTSNVDPIEMENGRPVAKWREVSARRSRFGVVLLAVGAAGALIVVNIGSILVYAVPIFWIALLVGAHWTVSRMCPYCKKLNLFSEMICRNCGNPTEFELGRGYSE